MICCGTLLNYFALFDLCGVPNLVVSFVPSETVVLTGNSSFPFFFVLCSLFRRRAFSNDATFFSRRFFANSSYDVQATTSLLSRSMIRCLLPPPYHNHRHHSTAQHSTAQHSTAQHRISFLTRATSSKESTRLLEPDNPGPQTDLNIAPLWMSSRVFICSSLCLQNK